MSTEPLAISEALRNARATPLFSTITAAVCLAVGIGLAALTAVEVRRAADAARSQYLAGSSVIEATGQRGAPLDALRCHSLVGVEGVIAAGGVMAWETVQLDAEPGADLRLITTTPGFPVVSWPEFEGSGPLSVIAASDLARSGMRGGDVVSVSSAGDPTTLLKLDAVPKHVSTLGLDRMLLVTAPPQGVVASCFVLATPAAAGNVSALLADYFDIHADVRPRLLASELITDPDQILRSRVSEYGWLVAAVLCGTVLFGRWFARRNELALYRLLGVSESSILIMLSTEVAVLCLAPSQLGLLIGIGIGLTGPVHSLVATSLLVDILRFDLMLVVFPVIAVLALPRKSLLDALTGR